MTASPTASAISAESRPRSTASTPASRPITSGTLWSAWRTSWPRPTPKKKILCGAYSTYRLPPLSIDKLPDNVLVQITNGRPIREMDDESNERAAELRRQWQEKTNNPLSLTLNYTPFTSRGEYRPQYWPHVIARGLRDVKGQVWREDVWLSWDKGGLDHPGMSHLNPYVMSQLWWDPDQDVDVLLLEYYRLFYGPAAAEMQAFIEFCELHYAELGENAVVTSQALALFDQAKARAPSDSVYGRRIALVDAFLVTLRNRGAQILVDRPPGLPEFRLIDMAQDKWRDARQTLVMDGKLDEAFWTGYSLRGTLKDVHTGKRPTYQTEFRTVGGETTCTLAFVARASPASYPSSGRGEAAIRRSGMAITWSC